MICPNCGAMIDESNHYRCCRFPICDYQMKEADQNTQGIHDDYIVFDFETTGLDRKKDRIIEIGAVKVREGKIVDRFSMLLNPGRTQAGTQIYISSEITRITGITNQDLIHAPLESTGLQQFAQWCEGIRLCVGHNITSFDLPMLKHAAKRAGISVPFDQCIDTLRMVRSMKLKKAGKIPNEKQTTLAEYCGFTYHAHRALDDVEALYRIFVSLCREYTPLPAPIKEKENK